jgi:hypothetical protein
MSVRTPITRTTTWVMQWCDLYSRGLPQEVVAARREELSRDMADQVDWATCNDTPQRHVAWSIGVRAVRGAPADLSWRSSQRFRASLDSPSFRAFSIGFLSMTVASGFVLFLIASVSIIRQVQEMNASGVLADRSQLLVLVAAVALLLGEALLARPRTRSLGALWMLVSAEAIVFAGMPMLAGTTRLLSLTSLSPSWSASMDLAGLGVAIFYATGALWWLPRPVTAEDES